MERLSQDLRYAFRTLLQHRGFTAVAVATLALGIGANTAIFTVVNALLFRPLAVTDPDRLVAFSRAEDTVPCSYPEYVDFRDRSQVFAGLAASGVEGLALDAGGESHVVLAELVSGNYFSVMGLRAHLGRLILPDDDRAPGASPVAVVSHGTWQRRFGADPHLVGRSITLNGQPLDVVGIAPEGFLGAYPPASVEVWAPLMMAPQLRGARGADSLRARGRHWLAAIGRLGPGIGLGEAQAATRLLDRQIQEAHPETHRRRESSNPPWSVGEVTLLKLRAFYMPSIRRAVGTVTGLIMAVVFLVLLIACANVANLALARGAARRREIAIRLALGASRGRIVRQLLTESLLLALLGAGAGLLLALWTADLLIKLKPPVGWVGVMFAPDISPDARVLGFTLLLSVLTGLLFGLAPAVQASRPEVVPALKDEVPAAGQRSRRPGLRSLLVIGQVAVSLVLLIVTGLFVRSVQQTQRIDPGFDTANGVAMRLDLTRLGYSDERGQEFYRRLRERLQVLPGVRASSLASYLPFSEIWTPSEAIAVEGRERPPDAPPLRAGSITIDPAHLPTLGIALLRGRHFTAEDTQAAPPVVIVSRTMARDLWPGQEAIGKRLAIVGPLVDSLGVTPSRPGPPLYRLVIGVAEDIKYQTLSQRPRPVMYLPLAQRYSGSMYVVVRVEGDPTRMATALRHEVRSLDRGVPIDSVKTLAEHVDVALGFPRLLASLVGIFGLVAIVLAAVGIYGVVAYSVSQRTREIGIRIALGADRLAILKLVVGQGIALVLAGVGLGLPAAIAARQALWSLLHSVTLVPGEPLVFVALSLLLALVGLLASYAPSRRAVKVDPLVALRAE